MHTHCPAIKWRLVEGIFWGEGPDPWHPDIQALTPAQISSSVTSYDPRSPTKVRKGAIEAGLWIKLYGEGANEYEYLLVKIKQKWWFLK